MSDTTKFYVVAAIAVVAIIGAYFYPKFPAILSGSTAGSTFGSAKFAGIAVNLAAPGANATSSSLYNNDSGDRYISSIKAGCEGVGSSNTAYSGAGLAALTLSVATSSTAAPATNGNAIKVGGGTVTLGTSTPFFAVSTSTIGTSGGIPAFYFVWNTGTYLTFTTNATNTALCTFGVDYFAS